MEMVKRLGYDPAEAKQRLSDGAKRFDRLREREKRMLRKGVCNLVVIWNQRTWQLCKKPANHPGRCKA